ncbi:MAG: NAD(P) transhydrogenase subunit alpha [Actinobacteria bacterium]|nr:NAD(P) transhydrogenase subunit alpha [Actinomycetota bacterium]OPZ76910.1 MAG: NAD(P) transhydrogenase subunit alpha [Actinobacteria bacterium ADurb.Bin444]
MTDIILMILVFVVASVAGYLLISRVPQRLHTPLMSMTNAISGVTIIGAVLLFSSKGDAFTMTLGGVAVVMAAFNLVGGFAITNRMLGMFKSKRKDAC